ncbi:MAG: hypothetical protein IJU76_07290 [Desulfovibrionaceae bacterium]|nr:hypothetical protein [Desulfovibrionaceae bacterium]
MAQLRPSLIALLFCLSLALSPLPLLAAQPVYELQNAEPEKALAESPLLILQDGRRVDPFVYVPQGWVVSDDGSLLSDDGFILRRNGTIEYPFGKLPEGYVKRADGTIVTPEGLVLAPKGSAAHSEALRKKERDPKADILTKYPKGTVLLPDGTVRLPDGTRILSNGTRILADGTKILPDGTRILADGTKILPDGKKIAPKAPAQAQQENKPEVRTEPPALWSMLPLSQVGERKNPEKAEVREKGKVKEESAVKEKPERKKEGRVQEDRKKDERKKEEAKKEERPKPEPKRRPPRIGEELSIPKEALATGNLDFLEGCWQGTRPEYFSKRTIYECFCFGKSGGRGKRRVIDPQGHRRCVGASAARLSGNGVLHVSSQGAVCSDGERWGQAEMTCRGKGQHTPCSWIFRDANSGHQAYEIPFVRVQSCGRR